MPNQNNQHIHCSVENCHYYSNGNVCVANEIMVMGDNQGDQYPDRVDHQMAKEIPTYTANSCSSTCCKTFVPKGSDKVDVDGSYRMS